MAMKLLLDAEGVTGCTVEAGAAVAREGVAIPETGDEKFFQKDHKFKKKIVLFFILQIMYCYY